jgi:hypothetical protein
LKQGSEEYGSKADLVKILVKDLYAKQAEIIKLKHEIDYEFMHESGGSTPCDGGIRNLEKVSYL